jgi:hypothetical protein
VIDFEDRAPGEGRQAMGPVSNPAPRSTHCPQLAIASATSSSIALVRATAEGRGPGPATAS